MKRLAYSLTVPLGIAMQLQSSRAYAEDLCRLTCLKNEAKCDLSGSPTFNDAKAPRDWPALVEFWEAKLRNEGLEYDRAIELENESKKAVEAITAEATSSPTQDVAVRLHEAKKKLDDSTQKTEKKRQEVACLANMRDLAVDAYDLHGNWKRALSIRGSAAMAATKSHVLGVSGVYTIRRGGLDASAALGLSGFGNQLDPKDPKYHTLVGLDLRAGVKWGEALYTFGLGAHGQSDFSRFQGIRAHFGVGYRTGDNTYRRGDNRFTSTQVFGAGRVFVEPWFAPGQTTQVLFGVEFELGASLQPASRSVGGSDKYDATGSGEFAGAKKVAQRPFNAIKRSGDVGAASAVPVFGLGIRRESL